MKAVIFCLAIFTLLLVSCTTVNVTPEEPVVTEPEPNITEPTEVNETLNESIITDINKTFENASDTIIY